MCHKCKSTIDTKESINFNSICSNCGKDLHCCLNCKLYKEDVHYSCLEPNVELVRDKDRKNFCEFFIFNDFFVEDKKQVNKTKQAMDDFNNLFGS